MSNLVKILKDTAAIDLEIRQKFGVLDVASRKWLIKPTAKSHAWGVVETHARKYHVALLEYDEQGVVTCDDWRRVAVSSESVVYSDMAKLRTLRRLLRNGEPHVSSAKVVLVDGVPGCGKTKEILSRVNFDEDLILVPGKQAAEMIRRRANSSGIIVATKDNVKTVDSFMMNFGKSTHCQFKRLFIDEGLICILVVLIFLWRCHCAKLHMFTETHSRFHTSIEFQDSRTPPILPNWKLTRLRHAELLSVVQPMSHII